MEGLLSTGPTPSSLLEITYSKNPKEKGYNKVTVFLLKVQYVLSKYFEARLHDVTSSLAANYGKLNAERKEENCVY